MRVAYLKDMDERFAICGVSRLVCGMKELLGALIIAAAGIVSVGIVGSTTYFVCEWIDGPPKPNKVIFGEWPDAIEFTLPAGGGQTIRFKNPPKPNS